MSVDRQGEVTNAGRGEVPTYDFRCAECRKKFSLIMTIGQRIRKRVKCPKCGSGKAEAVFSGFFAKTSRKS
jgi:putative FmdB family regulatory protein